MAESIHSDLNSPSFFADVMLGSLARWLRVLGFDTKYRRFITDLELINLCLSQNRIALTRDRRLVERKSIRGRSILVSQEELQDQLREILQLMNIQINPDKIFSRCLECNSILLSVDPLQVRHLVPPYVFKTQDRFCRCEGCKRIYWSGTHRPKILDRLKPILDEFQVKGG